MLKKGFRDFAYLTKRNVKVFLKDRASFLTSLISPFVIVILYVTFLKRVYDDSLLAVLGNFGVTSIPDSILGGFSSTWLMSSIMAVTCVTLTFCGNTIVVSDRLSGAINDIEAAPISRFVISLAYFAANCLSTLLVSALALGLGFAYIAIAGWYLSGLDVLMIVLLTVLLTLFGSLFASIIMSFLTSQGAITACSVVVSALYGFVCGAYMPISSFGEGVANVIYCLPGTYGTMALRHYFCSGALAALQSNLDGQIGTTMSAQAIASLKRGFDIQLVAFDNEVSLGSAISILGAAVIGFFLIYALIVFFRNLRGKTPKNPALADRG
jgi:multidrug/hemolysin transport system permease protein